MNEFHFRKLRVYKIAEYIFELLLMIGLFALCDKTGMQKYALSLVFCLSLFILGRKRKWSVYALLCAALPMLVYLFMGITGALFHANFYESTLKVLMFWFVPFFVAFSLYVYYGKKMERIVDLQFLSSCVMFFRPKVFEILIAMHFESIYAFTFGLFSIYYVYKKRWGFCMASLVLMYIADKRITILGVVVALAVMGLMWIFRNNWKLALFIWGIVSVVVNLYIYLIYSGTLDYFCRGIGINTNGRLKMYGRVTEWFGGKFLWFGEGLGVIEMLLNHWNISTFSNLHNDLLKFYIELGMVGLVLFLASYGISFVIAGKHIGKSQMSFLLAASVYTMILFATDNVSIYIVYLIPLNSIYFAIFAAKEKETIVGEPCK